MFDHLIPHLSAAEWAVLALLAIATAAIIRSRRRKLMAAITVRATREDVTSLKKSIADNLVNTVIDKLITSLPAAIDEKQASELARLRNEAAQLQERLQNDNWVLARVIVYGYQRKREAAQEACYALVMINTTTGKLRAAPEALRRFTPSESWQGSYWGQAKERILLLDLGSPRWSYLNGETDQQGQQKISMLGGVYEYG